MATKVSRATNDIILILGLLFLYYCSIENISAPVCTLLFVMIYLILYIRNDMYSFFLAFFLNIDITGTFLNFMYGGGLLTIAGMFLVLLKKPASISFRTRRNPKIMNLLLVSVIFSLYFIFISLYAKSNYVKLSHIVVVYINYIFGFLIFLPAYYLTRKNRQEVFRIIVIITILFLIAYFINLIVKGSLFFISENLRNQESTIKRTAGIDIRQTFIFFTFLIPAILVMNTKSKVLKYILLLSGILAMMVLIIGILRLAVFYTIMGTLLSAILISRYTGIIKFLKWIFAFFILILIAYFIFPTTLTDYLNIYSWTMDSVKGQSTDSSFDVRFLIEAPFLLDQFFSNIWTGIGFEEMMNKQAKFGYFPFVDIPFLGTLSVFGIIGMIIYYMKFYILLAKSKITHVFTKNFEIEMLLFLTLKAYLITMITFRLFYISWELTFDYQQVEFGLFSGIFLALGDIINLKNQSITYNMKIN